MEPPPDDELSDDEYGYGRSDHDQGCESCDKYIPVGAECMGLGTEDDYDEGMDAVVCMACYSEEKEGHGTCTKCDTDTTNGKYHKIDREKLLCPACFGKEEELRAEMRSYKFNPIGHLLDWKNVVYPVIDHFQIIQRNSIAARHMGAFGSMRAFGSLKTFLEAELNPLFDAFKASDDFKSVSTATADSTDSMSLSLLDSKCQAADEDDGEEGEALPTEKPAGATAADSYSDYVPAKLTYGPPHVEHVVESASLACVAPTDITFTPSLPADAMSNGVLSRVQLEAVVYSLQQHEKRLPSGYRAGFFIGDGTGVGKGRELAAIVWDNWLRTASKGKRSIWFTCNTDLAVDARRDLDDIGAKDIPLKNLSAAGYGKLSADYGFDEGVLLVTYSCLVAKSGVNTRYQQIKTWLTEGLDDDDDFEGVLAFDEAHKAKGAAHDQPVGRTVVQIQEALKGARVVYLSATGATQVQDMSYMTRLGLWGRGTYFSDFKAIESVLSAGGGTGAGAMEMLAVQLKSSGAYLARNLGLRGVDFHMPQVKLTDEQASLYDECAKLWVEVHSKLGELAASGAVPTWEGAYTAAQTRFFQQLILSFKVPEIERQARIALRAGKCVVIGLQSTGDSAVEKTLSSSSSSGGAGSSSGDAKLVSSLVSAAREVLDSFLGTLETKQQASNHGLGSSYELSGFKRIIQQKLDALKLPPAALDSLIDYFGVEHVAEMTGRQKRLQRRTDGSFEYVSRAERGVSLAKINLRERARFQSGEKLIAILSDAGATGVSLHADQTQPNQRRRFHIVPELGWSASKIVQQFGRSHRTNQLTPPEYVLLTCESAGEALVGSAVARKLEGLGALTKGDKHAGRGETGFMGTNLETKVGLDALTRLKNSFGTTWTGEGDERKMVYTLGALHFSPNEASLIRNANTVKSFLTRLQLMPYKSQTATLRAFTTKIKQTDEAMASQLESTSVRIVNEKVVFENRMNDAEKVTVTEIECDHSCAWDAARQLHAAHATSPSQLCAFFVEKDNYGRPNYNRILLAIPIDAARVRLCYPHRVKAGTVANKQLASLCLMFDVNQAAHRTQVENLWKRNFDTAVSNNWHRDSFALLNGSVFSIWYNVRKAMDPGFDPDMGDRHSMRDEAEGGGAGRSRGFSRNRGYQFQPNVKIQLVTTSDGKKLGGIRLSTFRPLVHCKGPPWPNPQCNKAKAKQTPFGGHVFCRRKACLVEGYNEVDKLVKGLAIYRPSLSG